MSNRRPERPQEDTREPAVRSTPETDMQPEDAGTPESQRDAARGTASESAMKQTSKTPQERGSAG